MTDKLIIHGMFWSAGDNIYIDVRDNEGKCKCVCINDLMKEHIEQNTILDIEITIETR